MELVLISFAFLALLLFVIWLPFFKQQKQKANENANVRDETNVRLYHEHKKEIEKDFKDGGIDDENYQYLLAELDSSLLQDIEANDEQSTATKGKEKSYSVVWPVLLSVFIVGFSVYLYDQEGHFTQITQKPVDDARQVSAEQMQAQREKETLAHIKDLQQKIKVNADDAEAWYNLGQTFVIVGEFDSAIKAFEQVIRVEGDHADLLGAIAQAHYYKNNQQLDATVQSYIDRALALDENDASTNILLGMHNFIGGEYQQAIDYWQRVITANRQGVNIAALKEAVAEANSRLGVVNNTPNVTPQVAEGPQLKVEVSLSAEMAEQLAQGDDRVVFVYAIPTNGQRMPLAAVKIMASDLPKIVVLNNSQAMTPEMTISSVEQVHLFAIASKQGGAGIKPGDFKAQQKDIAVSTTETVALVIDSLVE